MRLCYFDLYTSLLLYYRYLQEIGYSETILDVRSFRVKSLLGMLPPEYGSDGFVLAYKIVSYNNLSNDL